MAGVGTVIARTPGRLEFQLALAFAILLTGWSIAVAAWTYSRTPSIADFAQLAKMGSWRAEGKIVYLFAPAFLQGLASLFLTVPLLPQRIQPPIHIGLVPRRWHLLLLMLFVVFWLCDTHLRSAWALRLAGSSKAFIQ